MGGINGTKLLMVDTHHQAGYDRLRPLAYVDADLFLLCFSVDCPDSMWNIKERVRDLCVLEYVFDDRRRVQWVEEVARYSLGAPALLVGCKSDLRGNESIIRELRLAGQDLVMREEVLYYGSVTLSFPAAHNFYRQRRWQRGWAQ